MDIQKENNAYLATLVQQEAITQDEFKDIAYKPEINAFHSKYLSSHFVDNINWGWNAWQAAKAQAVPERFFLVEKKKIESWYLDEHEGMYTDEPDNFLHELEIGEVQAVEHRDYLIIKERTLYAARPWDNDSQEPDCWHLYEAKSEAESVADRCKKKWNEDEAQEPSHDS